MAREGKITLPKPASTASDARLNEYLQQFAENGDRRVLAAEILRLRAVLRQNHVSEDHIILPAPTATPKAAGKNNADNELI